MLPDGQILTLFDRSLKNSTSYVMSSINVLRPNLLSFPLHCSKAKHPMNWSVSKPQSMNFVNFYGITFTSSSAHQIMLSGIGCLNIRCGGLPNCYWPYLLRKFTK